MHGVYCKAHHIVLCYTHYVTYLNLCGFLTPPTAALRLAGSASCLRGALPPVTLRAVCLVRAMITQYSLYHVMQALELLVSCLSSCICMYEQLKQQHYQYARSVAASIVMMMMHCYTLTYNCCTTHYELFNYNCLNALTVCLWCMLVYWYANDHMHDDDDDACSSSSGSVTVHAYHSFMQCYTYTKWEHTDT